MGKDEFQKEIEQLTKEVELEHTGGSESKSIIADFEVASELAVAVRDNNSLGGNRGRTLGRPIADNKLSVGKNQMRMSNACSYNNRLGKIRTPKLDLFDGENPHEGHRARKKKSADKDPDFATFSEVEMLEYLLYNTIPRIDTNELAHLLIRTFGSYYGVLNAHLAELKQIPHINEATARMLTSILSASRKAEISRLSSNAIVKDTLSAVEFIAPYFLSRSTEYVYLTNLNNHDRVISMDLISTGETNYSAIDTKKVIESACRHKATKVILSHNHPSGCVQPSNEDREVTQQLMFSLLCAKVILLDHIIISNEGYYSFFANQEFDKMYEKADSVFNTNLVRESRNNRFNYRKSLGILGGGDYIKDNVASENLYIAGHSKASFLVDKKREDE